MREIKFRAWDADAFVHLTLCSDPLQYAVLDKGDKLDGVYGRAADSLKWEQYTGLKDKNGVEIYESDLFDAWDGRSKYIVEWQEAHACFKLVWVSGDVGDSKVHHYFDMYMAEYQFEPAGNIYENKELLND